MIYQPMSENVQLETCHTTTEMNIKTFKQTLVFSVA